MTFSNHSSGMIATMTAATKMPMADRREIGFPITAVTIIQTMASMEKL